MVAPTARAEMLIRSPVAHVFDAFVRPETITRFWLDSTTGPLAAGARLEWAFKVPGARETVTVTTFEDRRCIGFDWSDGVHVTITFAEQAERTTRLSVEATGFHGPDAVDRVVGATEGFSIVLCDLKTLLETGQSARLVDDKAELISSASAGATAAAR